MFTYFSAPACLYRQLVRHSMTLLVLPFLPCAQFTPSVNEPTGFTSFTTFTNFSARAGLYSQLVRQLRHLLGLPFYHFLPILAPHEGYIAN